MKRIGFLYCESLQAKVGTDATTEQGTTVHHDRERHERIKMRLRIAGTSFADLARSLGVSDTNVSSCSFGRRRSAKVQKAIADALNTTPEALFPERYHNGKENPVIK